ncbi:MAG: DUF1028 domain-containing protein [Candidatus Bathyarchaeota archaeon]|nr:DUF1028 domain-containing protein [Candidatus Bathyarchaeota archaeon]MDH5787254.1 DUF1028 domain-containing protein [Candidatus Bathyarchaeota archaeon]
MKRNIDLSNKITCLVPTYSIVAYDHSTGDLGVAVQSRYFSVGPIVPWAEADVGAIATQSFANVSYGPRGLQLLKEGLTCKEVIARLTSADEGREHRQLGIVDAEGNAAAYTGTKCLKWAGSKVGKCYSAQGNILANRHVVEKMTRKFEFTKGDLANRLVVALEAGEKAGGDARGRQSAALLVVRKNAGRGNYGDKFIELRVEDNPDPIKELKRLLKIHRVYYLIDDAESKFTGGDPERAVLCIKEALKINPRNDDAYLDLGLMYLRLERTSEAVNALRKALDINPKMSTVIKQLSKLGITKIPESLLEKLQI